MERRTMGGRRGWKKAKGGTPRCAHTGLGFFVKEQRRADELRGEERERGRRRRRHNRQRVSTHRGRWTRGRGGSGAGRAASRRISRGREDGETELAGAALGNEEDGEGVEVEGGRERAEER